MLLGQPPRFLGNRTSHIVDMEEVVLAKKLSIFAFAWFKSCAGSRLAPTSARVNADVMIVNRPATMSFKTFSQTNARYASSSAINDIQLHESQ